jgi:outer membrane protein TolC
MTANNPQLKAAIMELESASWAVVREEAAFAFVLQLDGGVTRTAQTNLIAGGVSTNESYSAGLGAQVQKRLVWGTNFTFRLEGNWQPPRNSRLGVDGPSQAPLGPGYGLSARLSVLQPLLRGAGSDVGEAQVLAARVRRTAAEYSRDRTASELLRTALTAYWELWYAHAALGIQEQSRAVAVRQRDEAVARAKIGALAQAEVLSFETRVATRDEDVLNADVERRRRQVELFQQLGTLEKQAAAGAPKEEVPPIPPAPPSDVEQAALAESPELRALEADLELARLQARTAEEPYRPRLDVEAYVQAQGLGNNDVGAALTQFGTLGAVGAYVGFVFETPLDSSGRRAEAARARLAVEIASERLAQARQGISSEVRIALTREAAARRKLELAEQTARIARQQFEAEQARFQTGVSTTLAVLEAEEQVRGAELRVARARADLLGANLSLQHLSGRLLVKHAGAVREAPARKAARGTGLRVGAF